ncbi:hypothetical protein Ddye_025775 [Dipteronia dyeriana]|uniref:Protein FAR1-RELATED SEQUENCE n=1 Tax=Dipteronia dyeriana TaxID=168575 RepID=A0AAD9WPX2_9ROSI|nr:hypothetical protein Ddye_025775 [Dipteronia dyeriana]
MYNRIDVKRHDESLKSNSHAALIYLQSKHKIYGWHISKNTSTHLHKEEKKSPFRYLLYKQILEDEFEELWKEMLEQHGLEENDWMSRMYEMNHSREKLFGFIPQIDKALIRLRNNFFGDEYVSKCQSPVTLSHLKPLEEHVSFVYTYQIYLHVAKQIMNESNYTHNPPEGKDNCRVYHLSRYQFRDKKRKVVYHLDKVGFQEVDEDGVWDSDKQNQPLITRDCNLFEVFDEIEAGLVTIRRTLLEITNIIFGCFESLQTAVVKSLISEVNCSNSKVVTRLSRCLKKDLMNSFI